MIEHDRFALLATVNPAFLYFEDLDDAGIAFWAGSSRWPLLAAVYLSMGFNPHAKGKKSGKMLELPCPTEEQANEFSNRIKLAQVASEDGSLIVDKVPYPNSGHGGPTVDREVDVKTFIEWAKENFDSNCEPLFDIALRSYSSSAHRKAGKLGSKPKRALLDKIIELANAELDGGCRCQHTELATYLRDLRRGGSFVIKEERLSRIGNQPTILVFREAVQEAFDRRELPLRHEKKQPGQERGKYLCTRHRDIT